MKFTSNKVINLGSAAFRQWRSTHSHCQFIHGYNLTANITFEANELDNKGWVADFGGLKDLALDGKAHIVLVDVGEEARQVRYQVDTQAELFVWTVGVSRNGDTLKPGEGDLVEDH